VELYLFQAERKPPSSDVDARAQANPYEDDYYPLNFAYIESHRNILISFIDYLRLESCYNPNKEFKFGIVVSQNDESRAALYEGGFDSKSKYVPSENASYDAKDKNN